jgi:hypothetical protein
MSPLDSRVINKGDAIRFAATPMPNNRVNADCQKLRRSYLAMQLLAAGYAQR